MTSTSSSARKTDLLLKQTRLHFPRFDEAQVEIKPIEKGGSDRRFYRVCSSPEHSLILVKYNLGREENRQYVQIAQFLTDHEPAKPSVEISEARTRTVLTGSGSVLVHRIDFMHLP